MPNELRNFLALSYDELEELNLKAKEQRRNRVAPRQDPGRAAEVPDRRKAHQGRDRALQRSRRPAAHARLRQEIPAQELGQPHLRRLLDPRLHRAARERSSPGHRLGRVLLGARRRLRLRQGAGLRRSHRQGRHVLLRRHSRRAEEITPTSSFKKKGYTLNAANEIEGFLFKGPDAERHYHETGKFEYVNTGGYYHSLPGDPLRTFIDTTAEVQRAMGFQNEKDHPEVAPSQFEINYGYGEVVAAADQIQLYKLICRQVATNMGLTASFLPKPVVGVNGSGMHTNVSISENGKNLFWDAKGEEKLSKMGWAFRRPHPDPRQRHLPAAESQRERLSPPRSALRSAEPDQGVRRRSRLDDPHSDRQREEHARRSALGRARRQPVPGDATRSSRRASTARPRRSRTCVRPSATCPTTSTTRSTISEKLEWTTHAARRRRQGPLRRPEASLRRPLPAPLGTFVKAPEVQFHHEVYNQFLWNLF